MKKTLYLLVLLAVFMTACHKKTIIPDNPTVVERNGLYILNQGLWGHNNSTLSYYNLNTGEVTADIYTAVNNRGLGDTGNDLQPYGSKLYCVVNISENVEVMDLYTAKVIGTVPLQGKLPRRICFSGSKAYVSCFDGTVVRIDTASLAVEATVTVGPNPEGVCIANGKLYVANSGGLSELGFGTTVSVINLSSFSVIKDIEVAVNPNFLYTTQNQQDIYLISWGNYSDISSCLQKISTLTDEVVRTFDFEITKMCIDGSMAYMFSSSYISSQLGYTIQVMDLTTETIVNENFITDNTVLNTPFSIAVNPQNGDVYVFDSHNYVVNGDIYCFGQDGKRKFSFEAGVNPWEIVFLN